MRPCVIVAAAFCVNAFTFGPLKSYGPFFLSFERSLNATAGQASLATSLMWGGLFLAGPFGSVLANRYGYRATMLFGAGLASIGAIVCSFSQTMAVVEICATVIGLGCGITGIPAYALLGSRFKEKRSLVNNIMTTGSAFMSIPLSPIVQLWIDEYSWRGAVLLLGGIFLNALPCGLLLTMEKRTEEEAPNKKFSIDFRLLKSFSFITFIIGCGFDISASVCVSIYLVRFAQSRGVGNYIAASLPSILSFVDSAVRPVSGYVTSLSHIGPVPIRRIYIFAGILFTQAFVSVAFAFCWNYESLVVITAAFSVIMGCKGALALTLTADLFGAEKLVNTLGWRYLVMGTFSAAMPALVGSIVDSTGSYAVPYYASGAMALISFALILVAQATNSRPNVPEVAENVEFTVGTSSEIPDKA